MKIHLNIVSTIGFTTKLIALNFDEDGQTLLMKAFKIAWDSTAHVYQYFTSKSLNMDVTSGLLALA